MYMIYIVIPIYYIIQKWVPITEPLFPCRRFAAVAVICGGKKRFDDFNRYIYIV